MQWEIVQTFSNDWIRTQGFLVSKATFSIKCAIKCVQIGQLVKRYGTNFVTKVVQIFGKILFWKMQILK